jgi:hypothetical protein
MAIGKNPVFTGLFFDSILSEGVLFPTSHTDVFSFDFSGINNVTVRYEGGHWYEVDD